MKTKDAILLGGAALAAAYFLPKLLGPKQQQQLAPPPPGASPTWIGIVNNLLKAGVPLITAWINANNQTGENHPVPNTNNQSGWNPFSGANPGPWAPISGMGAIVHSSTDCYDQCHPLYAQSPAAYWACVNKCKGNTQMMHQGGGGSMGTITPAGRGRVSNTGTI